MEKLIISMNGLFEAKTISYRDRILDAMKIPVIFYCLLFIGIGISSSYRNALVIVIFFFLYNLIEFRSWQRNYILKIVKNGEELEINYLDKNTHKCIKGKRKLFSFEKKQVWYKIRGNTTFLSISFNDQIQIKQFIIKDFDERTFDSIIDKF